MSTDPIISIIMPVYNPEEEHLREAIKSIRRQAFRDFELIIVNDGSTNNAEDVILSIKDERFKYLKQANAGPGKARNEALKIAKGKYILFVDADDCLDLFTLETSFDRAESQNLDVLIFKVNEYPDTSKEFYNSLLKHCKNFSEEKIYTHDDQEILEKLFSMNYACWGKIFRRQFLINNNLLFHEGLIFEDLELFVRYMTKAERIGFINSFLYSHRTNVETSILYDMNSHKIFDFIKVFTLVEQTLIKNNILDKIRLSFYKTKFELLSDRCANLSPEIQVTFKELANKSNREAKLTREELIELERECSINLRSYKKENQNIDPNLIRFYENYIYFLDNILDEPS